MYIPVTGNKERFVNKLCCDTLEQAYEELSINFWVYDKLQSVQTLFVNNFKQLYCDSKKV